jgi:alanine racemase
MPRQTQAIIHLDNIKQNFHLANCWAPESKNMAVLKGNAYGHGLVEVAKALNDLVPAFGVAILEEAIQLRNAGIKKPILVLQGVQSTGDYQLANQLDLWLMIHSLEQLQSLITSSLKKRQTVWLKVDTGMHRLGLEVSEFQQAVDTITNNSWIDNQFVVCSHLASASQITDSTTSHQIERFNSLLESTCFAQAPARSLANSAALVGFPDCQLEWNRPGIMLYGGAMFEHPHASDDQLKAAMTFESTVMAVRKIAKGESVGYGQLWQAENESIIATVAVGYADGYPRSAVSGTPALINGKVAKLAGRVSMDLITLDITHINKVGVGDKVELWGPNLPVAEVAKFASTISYDLLAGVTSRVPRIYYSH